MNHHYYHNYFFVQCRYVHSLPFVTNITAEDISGSKPAEVENLGTMFYYRLMEVS